MQTYGQPFQAERTEHLCNIAGPMTALPNPPGIVRGHTASATCVRAPTPGHLQFCTGTTAPPGWPSPLSTGAASSRPSRHESTCAPAPTHPQLRHRQLAPATLCQAALANAAPMWPFCFCTLGPVQSPHVRVCSRACDTPTSTHCNTVRCISVCSLYLA